MFDWNDLRHFLAVARTGSTLAASRKLRVSQATVSRRVGVLEHELGIALFARSASGYRLTPRGEALLPAAEAVETAVAALVSKSAAETRRLSGSIRIATAEGAGNAWVVPAVATFRRSHPDVHVELLAGDPAQDYAQDDVDIMIRFGDKPTQETLYVRHLADLDTTIFASGALIEQHGMPKCYADLARYPIVSFSGANGISEWFDTQVPGAEIVYRSNSMTGIIVAVRSGVGAGMGPSFLGGITTEMVPLFPPIPELKTSAWLVTTETARQQPHVRAMIDHLVSHIVASILQALNAGEGAAHLSH